MFIVESYEHIHKIKNLYLSAKINVKTLVLIFLISVHTPCCTHSLHTHSLHTHRCSRTLTLHFWSEQCNGMMLLGTKVLASSSNPLITHTHAHNAPL